MKYLITGGAGFIGSALVRRLASNDNNHIINIDSLTYAGNLNSLNKIENKENYIFIKLDICETEQIKNILIKYKPNKIIHLAAESHVDNSINSPENFLKTNIYGTFSLLEACRFYYEKFKNEDFMKYFNFLHVSTDEVFGDLEIDDESFSEVSRYLPSSPYSASKASSDHLVRSWNRTYGLPAIITNCSNNYGPFHYPEKLIPKTIINAISGINIPVYGNGKQIRDWLYVDDHVNALIEVSNNGLIGENYNIGGNAEKENIQVVKLICDELDNKIYMKPNGLKSFRDLINYVEDRAGHDKRYSIDASKIISELDWSPKENFSSGIKKTIDWYINNEWWWKDLIKNK